VVIELIDVVTENVIQQEDFKMKSISMGDIWW
jgi:hypothetical protein